MSPIRPVALITDIPGVTTPFAYVRDVLFPFARARLAEAIGWPEAAEVVSAVRAIVPGRDVLTTLHHWMDQDAKIAPLKTLQGMIWREGFADGALSGLLYADVAPNLRRWRAGGVRLFIYSAGSVEAQKLIFRHAGEGDLSGLFSGHFDTHGGGKREPDSYIRLAIGMNVPTLEVLVLSGAEAELDAAAAAGLLTCQMVRAADGAEASDRHPIAADFAEVSRLFGLPGA